MNKKISRRKYLTCSAFALAGLMILMGYAENAYGQTLISHDMYSDHSLFYGREYYILRSGRAEMIVQADKAGFSPAFSFLLFDAENAQQSARKSAAYNYTGKDKFYSSAVEIVMKDFAFTAVPQTCDTKWTECSGIPSASALWWASGVKVEETITPLVDTGAFIRNITLTSADLMAKDTVFVKLSNPFGGKSSGTDMITYERDNASFGSKVVANYPMRIDSARTIIVGPIILSPKEKAEVKVYLAAEIPSYIGFEMRDKLNAIEKNETSMISQSADKWKEVNSISTEDNLVKDIYNASRWGLLSSVADNGTMNAGIFEYGAQWVRDASNTALGMVYIGEFETTRVMLEYMLEHMIKEEGVTMISGGFDEPDREQFDQMGEFMHVMKSYVDWTGDTSLLKKYRKKILAMVERPLHKNFRDETGMVHNRREYWERTFDDAYELAYQLWVVTGLRDAADLAKYIDAEKRANVWRKEADLIQKAMLSHPTARLVDDGHLIKRRNVTKEIVDVFPYSGWNRGAPATVESMSGIYPDATMALPVAMNFIDPQSELAQNTINELEELWNRRWSYGGYERYNSSSQGDMPGPWTFATTFIMRGQHEAGRHDLSRRSLQWLFDVGGGRTGAYFESIAILRSSMPGAGILPWSSAEVSYFIMHHMLGIKFNGEQMTIKPNLFEETVPVKADIRFRQSRINLEITGIGKVQYATINGKRVDPDSSGAIQIPKEFSGGDIKINLGSI